MRMRMQGKKAGLMLVAPIALVLAAAAPLKFGVAPESRLWVEGGSSVRSWKCAAGKLDATMAAEPFAAGSPIASLNGKVSSVSLVIPVAAMDCGNGTMNGHMRKALKADANPTITFKLTSNNVAAAADGTGTVKMQGKLTIAGTERPITMDAKVAEVGGVLHVTGKQALQMTEYGVKPPTLMMGTMKVKDAVTVSYDIVLK